MLIIAKDRIIKLYKLLIIKYRKSLLIFLFQLISFSVFSYDAYHISLLKAGKINYALAEWWLLDEDYMQNKNLSDTFVLQNALSSGADFISITNIGRPWVTEPLFLESDTIIFFDRGVVITAKKKSFKNSGDKLISAIDKENIHLYGSGAELRMNRADYTYPPYKEGQWRHCLSFTSCKNVTIKGLSIKDSGGDGIYIGSSGKESLVNFCKDIIIEDILLSGHYRQGISIISGENILIKDCIIENTGTHLPSAGIDFEPNNDNQRLINCIIDSCVLRYNFGPGILCYFANLSSNSLPVSINITNCKLYTNRRPISIREISAGRKGYIKLENNLAIGFCGIDESTSSFKVLVK